MKNGVGGGGGLWLFSKQNIEIKKAFLNSRSKADGPIASSDTEGSELI